MDPLKELNTIGSPYIGKAQFEGVTPGFMDNFQQMAQEYFSLTGDQIKVNDAFRTREQQAEAYKNKPNLAAMPGHSRHERGEAMDIDETQANKLAEMGLFDKYGFHRPMMTKALGKKYEPWHIELMDFETRTEKTAGKLVNNPMAELAAIGKPESSDPLAKLSAIGKVPSGPKPYSPTDIDPATGKTWQQLEAEFKPVPIKGTETPADATSATLAQFANRANQGDIVIPDIKPRQQTQLSPQEEDAFQNWIKGLPWYSELTKEQGGQSPDLNDPNYDYRAAWKAGVVPQINPSDKKYHWPDFAGGEMMKDPHHPTAWAEYFIKQYGINPDDLPPNDPRVVEYSNAWHQKYPPRSQGGSPLEKTPLGEISDPLAQAANQPLIGKETLPEIALAAKEMVFGKPRSVMIPEERYQEFAKGAGIDVHPGWTKPLEMIGTQVWGGAKAGAAGLINLWEKLSGPTKGLRTSPDQGKAAREFTADLKKMLTTPPDMVGEDLASKVLQGLGSAPIGILEYGVAMEAGGPAGIAALEALKAEGGIKEKLGAAAGGALLGGAFKATGGLPLTGRVPAMAGIGGAQAAAAGGGAADITASAITMAVLATPGGRKLKEAVDTDTKPPEMPKAEWENVKQVINLMPPERQPSEMPPMSPETPAVPPVEARPVTTPKAEGGIEGAGVPQAAMSLELQRLHDSPVRERGFDSVSEAQALGYLKGLKKLAEKQNRPDLVKDIEYAENLYRAGDYEGVNRWSEASLSILHMEGSWGPPGSFLSESKKTELAKQGELSRGLPEVLKELKIAPQVERPSEAPKEGAKLTPAIESARQRLAQAKGVDPSKLQYIGDQEGVGPLFNIMDPEHPNYRSTVSAPIGEKKGIGEEGTIKPDIFVAPARAVIEDTAKLLKDAPEQIRSAGEIIKDNAKRLWDWYRHPFETKERGYRRIVNDYLGESQIAGHENAKYIKGLTKAVPDIVKRRAITRYNQAGGDENILRQWADKSKGEFKKIYEAALKLTPEEKVLAKEIAAKYDYYLQEAQTAGIVEHGLENYVNQLDKRTKHNKAEVKKLQAEINAGLLNTNFKYAKKRIFGSYFEREQASREAVSDDIAFLLGHYHQSMHEAINARRTIKALSDGNADDGRPLVSVSGAGKQLGKPGEEVSFEKAPGEYDMTEAKGPDAYLIRPRAKSEETSDYRYINHPALRKWKWVENDPSGAPILVQGDMYVHPEIYRHLKNVLGKSAVREYMIGRAALKISQNLKGVLLSGLPSGFHQVHLGSHAIFHKIDPFTCPPIDFKDPIQIKGVKNGLMVYNHNALAQFAEGLHSTGLAAKVPGIGRVTQAYGEYLFQDLIPRYKMKLFKEAYERNLKRYKGKYTDDQIAEISANQSNAAFGELNYKAMGRNPTMQDMFRLLALAPDFLEARGRFAGQAIRPGGREQQAAMLRAVIGMYGAGVVANMIFSDDHNPHWKKPFTLVVGKTEYALRSIPGDFIHLISDPRSFVYHRLNPTIIKPLIEFVTSRDVFGRKREASEQIADFFKGHVPIPAQGLVSQGERTLLQSALQSVGVSSWKHKTDLDKMVADYYSEQSRLNLNPEQRAEMEEKRKVLKKYQEGDKEGFEKGVAGLRRKEGIPLTRAQEKKFRERAEDEKKYLFKGIDISAAMKAFQSGEPEEKILLADEMDKKITNLWRRDKERYYKLESEINKVSEELKGIYKQEKERPLKGPKTYRPGDPEDPYRFLEKAAPRGK